MIWGEMSNGVRQFPCHEGQIEILNSKSRITFASAGTGGGKTIIIPLFLVQQIQLLADKGQLKQRHLVVSPTYALHKQSKLIDAWRETVEGTQLEGNYNISEHIYTTSSGIEIFFRSADTPNSLESGSYDSLVIDEAAKISFDAWIKASARVGRTMAPILLTSTPDTNNWLYEDIFKPCTQVETNPRYTIRYNSDHSIKIVQFGSILNPTYSPEEIERQRKVLPDAIFRRRYLGEFAGLDNLVYPQFEKQIINTNCPSILPSPAVRVCGGVDFGFNDPCSILIGVECQDGRIYIVDEIYETELTIDQLHYRLKSMQDKWMVEIFYCDSSRPEIAATMRKYNLPCVIKKVAAIETGILMVQSRLKTDYLKIYANCKNLIEESKYYQRKSTKDGDYSETPVDKFNHACDAFRYLITGMDFGRELHFDVAPEIAKGDIKLEAKIRLAIISPDPETRLKQEQDTKKQKAINHFNSMLLADDAD